MKIGFIGFGEAAYHISIGLKEQSTSGIIGFDMMSQDSTKGKLIRERAVEASVQLLATDHEVAEQCDVLFVAVPSKNTLGVCKNICKHLKPGMIYADVTASTPAVKQSIWDYIKDSGVLFVDAAMMGPLPLKRHKVTIMASGNGTQAFIDLMSPLGMVIQDVGEKPGQASAIKLIRSIYMKGIAALFIEMLQASEYFHVSEQVTSSISETMESVEFQSTINRLVTGTAIHSRRRAGELEGTIEMLEAAGLDKSMTQAAKLKHDFVTATKAAEYFCGRTPKHWREVIEMLS